MSEQILCFWLGSWVITFGMQSMRSLMPSMALRGPLESNLLALTR